MKSSGNQNAMPLLLQLVRENAGIRVDESDGDSSFFELGLDSLFLTQFSVSLASRFGVKLTFRQLSSALDTLNKLAAFLDEAPAVLPVAATGPQPALLDGPAAAATPRPANVGSDAAGQPAAGRPVDSAVSESGGGHAATAECLDRRNDSAAASTGACSGGSRAGCPAFQRGGRTPRRVPARRYPPTGCRCPPGSRPHWPASLVRSQGWPARQIRKACFMSPKAPSALDTDVETLIDPSADDDFDPFDGIELERVVPTTESQREIWLATQLGREASLAYNQVAALRLTGHLDVPALSASLGALADRHEALRATLSNDGMMLMIASSIDVPIQEMDLCGIDEAGQKVAVDRQCMLAVETPFDLLDGPLLRAQILALTPTDHVLLIAAHHVVCDGWSLSVIMKDLGTLYLQACNAASSELQPADRFSDYAAMEGSQQADPGLAAHEEYWLSRFQGELPRLNLPLDHPRPPIRSFASRREDRLLDAAFAGDLRRMAGGAGTSLFSVLAGGFAALVARLSGQTDIVIGVPSAGQSRAGMSSLVGHCVNLLPIRFQVAPAQTAAELLTGTRHLLLDALEHQQFTFGTLLQKLQIPRDPARVPLVGVMFNLDQPFELDSLGSAALRAETIPVARHFEAFELFLNIAQTPAGLRLECQYNTDLFAAQTVRRWLASYETLLRAILESPQSQLKTLSILDVEQTRTLAAWNDTALDHDRSRRVHDLIDVQARRVPNRAALTFAGATLTHGELRSRSNRLARAMRARGAGTRNPGGPLPGTRPGHGGGPAGGSEGGCGIRAAGPGLSDRAPRLHGAGCRAGRAGDEGGAGRAARLAGGVDTAARPRRRMDRRAGRYRAAG